MKFTFHIGDASGADQLGGKAGNLEKLHGHGFSVPEWFAVLPVAFEASLPKASLRTLVKETEVDGMQAILSNIAPPASLIREISSALSALCPSGELVAVRSSARDEDGRELSYAGQLQSFLFVPLDEVMEKMVAVWKSAFSARVIAYRRHHRIAGTPPAPTVIIQRMVHATAAGVAFGVDPVSGRPDLAVVSAVHGLGDSLVSGGSEADTWQVATSGKIIQCQRASKDADLHGNKPGQKAPDPGLDAAHGPALNENQVRLIAGLVRRAGELFGGPQDIEWALDNSGIHLLQSRAVTAVPSASPFNIWDNSNIIESYSGVTLPLTFSFARRAYEGVYREFCNLLAVPRAKIVAHRDTFPNMLGLIRGRVYYNLLNWYRVLALLPGFTINRRFMEQMMGVREELPAEVLAGLGNASLGAQIRDGFDVVISLAALIANHFLLPRKIRKFQRRLNEALKPTAVPLEKMNAAQLSAHYRELEQKLLTRWDAPLLNDFLAMIFFGVLRRLSARWIHDTEGSLQNDLLCGTGGMISTEPAMRLRRLAQLAAPHPQLVHRLSHGSLPEIHAAFDSVPEFRSALDEYLARFGDRCIGELKLENPALHDDPMSLLRSIGELAQRRSIAVDVQEPSAEPEVRKAAELRVSEALSRRPIQRTIFNWVLRHTRDRVRDRENLRFERTRLFGRVRRIFTELGRRLHSTHRLSDPRDVFLLDIDVVLGSVAGSFEGDLKSMVARRQTEFAGYQSTPPPPNRFTTRGDVNQVVFANGVALTPTDGNATERTGLGCCPGIVRGRIRKILDPRGAVIHQGEILVAERTDPGWILLFSSAAGLLVERGSLLSHSAIVAREMRIPAIVSIDGLTDWLQDGDHVEFDGSSGRIRRLEQSDRSSDVGKPRLSSVPAAPLEELSCFAP